MLVKMKERNFRLFQLSLKTNVRHDFSRAQEANSISNDEAIFAEQNPEPREPPPQIEQAGSKKKHYPTPTPKGAVDYRTQNYRPEYPVSICGRSRQIHGDVSLSPLDECSRRRSLRALYPIRVSFQFLQPGT